MNKIHYALASALAAALVLSSAAVASAQTYPSYGNATGTDYHSGSNNDSNHNSSGNNGSGSWDDGHSGNSNNGSGGWNGNSGNSNNGYGGYGGWNGNWGNSNNGYYGNGGYGGYGGYGYLGNTTSYYPGTQQLFVGLAYYVQGNSFYLYANGQWYTVYYASGYHRWNSVGGNISGTSIRSGDYVRVDGTLLNGVIYASVVRDMSR